MKITSKAQRDTHKKSVKETIFSCFDCAFPNKAFHVLRTMVKYTLIICLSYFPVDVQESFVAGTCKTRNNRLFSHLFTLDGNMIRRQKSWHEPQQEQKNSVEENVPPNVPRDARKNTTADDDGSEDELFGLALILRSTEDAARNSDSLCSVPEQHQSNKQETFEKQATSSSSKYEGDEPHVRCCPTLNRRLIIYKSFYFFFFSAVGSLFPYLAVFYKQLWLSAHETGILIGIRPLIQLFGTPLWGVVADSYKRGKVVFVMSLVAWLVSNYSLSLVSPVFHLGMCKDNATVGIVQEILGELENRTTVEKNFTSHHKQKSPQQVNAGNASNHWFEIVGRVKERNAAKRSTIKLPKKKTSDQVNRTLPVEDNQTIFRDASKIMKGKSGNEYHSVAKSIFNHTNPSTGNKNLFPPKQNKSVVKLNDHLMKRDLKLFIKSRKKLVKQRRMITNSNAVISKSDLLQLLHNSSNVNIDELSRRLNRERIERVFDSLNMAGEYPWPLDTVANFDLTQNSHDWQTPRDSHLFTILFVITAIGTLIAAPAITLADTATLQNLGNKPEDYGKQRLWGAFGWGLAAFIVGSSLSTIEEISKCNNPLSVDYLPCFYAFACLMGVALLIGALFEFDKKESLETNIWQGLAVLFDWRYMYFIITILFCGSALGFIETFLFWHLQDLGGTQFLFSTITAIHCISEVVVYCCSGMFIKWLGHHQVLYVGLSCYIIRFFGYAFISNSWLVLPFEILHGLSTAAVWSAAVVFVGLIPEAPATMQGILGGVHWGLGNGGGGVVGGLLITYAGATNSFLIFGIISLLDLSLFISLNNMEFFSCFEWSKGISTRTQFAAENEELENDYDELY